MASARWRFGLWGGCSAILLALLTGAASPQTRAQDAATEAEVRTRCGTACHKFPPPDILPRSAWRDELVRMMLIQEGVPEPPGGSNLLPLPPDWLRILRYYEALAPERLPAPEPWPAVSPAPAAAAPADASTSAATPPAAGSPASGRAPAFEKHAITRILDPRQPAIAHVRFLDVDGDRRLDVVASDMRSGRLFVADAKVDFGVKTLATLRHPAHFEMIDLDKDGRQDLLVADLGSYQPADHQDGAVVLLRRQADHSFATVTLAKGLPRLADARAADFDGDGDLDIIAAAFGWRRTGSLFLLQNDTKDWRTPRFTAKLLDKRTGAIHVPVADLDKDGRPDFVVLLAQEHESVVAFLNTGGTDKNGAGPTLFRTETIYEAPHPNWGSSGIELVDLDGDADLDVLFAHGDTFDDFVLKPYHGLLWLENRGTYPFTPHPLATLPGAQYAKAIDLDADTDLDIVATAMVAGTGDVEPTLASVVWLEQVRPRVFERRTLEMGAPFHATLDAADYDADGDADLVVGWFSLAKPVSGFLDLWENVTASRPAASPAPRR